MYSKLVKWFNRSCFWSHDYELKATEQRATAHECKKCGQIKLTRY
jgi:hypothetical protein